MAAVKPRRLKVSLVWVPLPDRACTTAEAPAFIAFNSAASSAALPGQAHSPSVNRVNLSEPIYTVTCAPLA